MDNYIKIIFFAISAVIVNGIVMQDDNIFARAQYSCEYSIKDDGSTICTLTNFHPGTSLFYVLNPENATEVQFTNSSHIRIPSTLFTEIPGLQNLNLSDFHIRRIQKSSFTNAVALKTLDLSYNLLQEVLKSTFKRASTLQELFLHNNNIEVVEYNAFKYLRNLTTLTLNNNHIKHLSKNAFEDLSNLRTLLLNDNRISVVSSALKPLRALEMLTLHNNLMHYVRVKVMNKYLRNLTNVTLQNNEWFCPGVKLMTDYMAANAVDTDVVNATELECQDSENVVLMMDEKDLAEIQELSTSTFINPVFNHHFH
uniref:CSON003119 protein n=1 Tax=Culicoides sonorensis TaxID=179676 RepID=A0A336LSG8_CULSO